MRLKNFSLPVGNQLFKALSDESRTRILYLLYINGEMCISDLEQILDFTQTKTSRHLGYLKNSGILTTRKNEQWVFYSIKEEVAELIEVIFSFMEKDKQLSQDLQNFNIMKSNRALALNKLESKRYRATV